MYIYKVTNRINKKIYIGQTTKSINSDYIGSGPIIIKAIKKYGKENFAKDILEECDSKDILNEREIYWINFYDSTNRKIGYNVSNGGNGGNLGVLVNQKISDALKGRTAAKDRYGNFFNIKTDDERFINGELVGIAKWTIPYNKGIPMSEEQKIKLRRPKNEAHKKKMSEVRIGKGTKSIICTTNNIEYNSIREAAEELNLTSPNVIKVLKGRAEKTKGYSFKYL